MNINIVYKLFNVASGLRQRIMSKSKLLDAISIRRNTFIDNTLFFSCLLSGAVADGMEGSPSNLAYSEYAYTIASTLQASSSSVTSGSATIAANEYGSDASSDASPQENNASAGLSVSVLAPADSSIFIEGESVKLRGSVKNNSMADLSDSLTWKSSLDGLLAGSGSSISTTSLSVGNHVITATYTDSESTLTTDSITVTIIANVEPFVSISTPSRSLVATLGDTIDFIASAIDSEDGDLTSSIAWSSSIDGPIAGIGPSTSTSTLSAGKHVVTASAVDSGALVGSDTITITVNTPSGPFLSDDFTYDELDTNLWTFVDPVGDSSYSINEGVLSISVPAGSDHDIWKGGNRVARVLQRIDDLDFGLQAKFGSVPTLKFQNQGILVEQNASNFIRFDFYSNGTSTYVFSAIFVSGEPKMLINKVIGSSSAYFLRVERSADQFTLSYSLNGTSWLSAGNLSHDFEVVQVGVYAGNASGTNSPAFTADVDYVFNLASPIFPEDDGGPNMPPTVSIATPANGAIFTFTEAIDFQGIANDVEDGDLSDTLTWRSDLDGPISGVGGLASTSNLSVGKHVITATSTASGSASITIEVKENVPPIVAIVGPVDGATIDRGETVTISATAVDSLDGDLSDSLAWSSSLDGAMIATGGSISMTDLSTGLHVITASAVDSGELVGSDSLMLTVNTPFGDLKSDDFDTGDLNRDLWMFEDPMGDSAYSIIDGVLNISVPEGSGHDIWTDGNHAARLSQRIENLDFDFQAKFGSTPALQFQSQGILVEQDASNFIRFDFYSNGSSLYVFGANFVNGEATILFNQEVTGSSEYFLRTIRSENQFTMEFSFDGTAWTRAGLLTHVLEVSKIGVYAGNASGADAPAFTAAIDYVLSGRSSSMPSN